MYLQEVENKDARMEWEQKPVLMILLDWRLIKKLIIYLLVMLEIIQSG